MDDSPELEIMSLNPRVITTIDAVRNVDKWYSIGVDNLVAGILIL